MSKILVAFFSASGVTARAAAALAQAAGAELFEIKPETPYTKADLDWRDSGSRSSVEMSDPQSRPAMAGGVKAMDGYETVFIGFPIWWYEEPRIVDTFLESCDFTGKTVIPFATSGSSGMGGTAERISALCPGAARVLPGRIITGAAQGELAAWIAELGVLT